MSILEEIKQSIPNRFTNTSPYHFEEFICELFRDSGYQGEITKSTGDFGADVILTKDNSRTAVQVKRYERENLVGVKEINQVIGGREYYKCDKAIIITTSDFTKAAKKLAEQTNIELWNWDKLYSEIKRVYLEGKGIYEFFKDKEVSISENQIKPKSENFSFSIDKIEENISMQDRATATVVYIKMTNVTDKKVYVSVPNSPIIIDTLGNQLEAYARLSGGSSKSFEEGYIYPRASVPLIFCWYSEQIPKSKIIKNVIVKYCEGSDEEPKEEFISLNSSSEIVNEMETKEKPKSGCFVATAVYGTSLAPEINILRDFRDKFLLKYKLGKEFVNFYYQFSPPIANFISKHHLLKFVLRELFIGPIVKIIKISLNYLKK